MAANASVSTTEIGTQVDLLPSPTPRIDNSVQTTIITPIQNLLLHGDVSTASTQAPTIFESHLDASIQASEPLTPPNQPQKVIAMPLDWAENANSLPVIPSPPSLPPQPHDLSVLRSSSSSPFSSLQHHSKRFTCRSRSHYRSHSNFNSFYSLHRYSFEPHSKTCSHLNWESDPWLSDLSHSLKALGCIHAS